MFSGHVGKEWWDEKKTPGETSRRRETGAASNGEIRD